MPEFYDVVQTRCSVRTFAERPVARDVLLRIIEAANAAPSAHNTQPWHFCVVESADAKKALMTAAGKVYATDLAAGGMARADTELAARESADHFSRVPILVCVFAVHEERPQSKGAEATAHERRAGSIERTLRRQSTAAATAQLLLAAGAEGLGACWYSLPLHCPGVIRRALARAANEEPVALVALGEPIGAPVRRKKKPAAETASFY